MVQANTLVTMAHIHCFILPRTLDQNCSPRRDVYVHRISDPIFLGLAHTTRTRVQRVANGRPADGGLTVYVRDKSD
jgi:hypothetical protein